jgi:putative acetyltransferase
MVQVLRAQTSSQIALARSLFQEYAATLGLDLCFQGFEQELARLPGQYAPPDGALLLAYVGAEATGCVGLRRFEAGVGEMKRLFVRSEFRGRGIGRALATGAVDAARQAGYNRVRLDTLASMVEAVTLYRSLGFQLIGPYRFNPDPEAVFLELEIHSQPVDPVGSQ